MIVFKEMLNLVPTIIVQILCFFEMKCIAVRNFGYVTLMAKINQYLYN